MENLFAFLNQSLWLDEATTARVVQQYSFSEILTKFSPQDFHPPLYYLFLKLWTNIFGYSEISLRFPSILFLLLAGWMIYHIGKTLKDEKTGVWAGVFFLFNPLIIYYSQEARMYMTVTFFLSISLYYFITIEKMLQIQKSKFKSQNFILFIIFSILGFYTFYGSVFLIAAFLLYLLLKKQYKYFLISFFIFNFSFLILFPLIYQQFLHSRTALQVVSNWSAVLGTANIKNLLLVFIKFSFGRISFEPKIWYYAVAGIWTSIIFFFTLWGGLKKKFLLFLFFCPLVLGIIFSIFSPLLQYFRFLYLIPIMSVLLAFGAEKNWQKYGVAAGFAVLSFIYLFNPQFHRENWKALASFLPESKPIYMIYTSSDPVTYYSPKQKIRDLRSIEQDIKTNEEFFVIPYSSDIHGYNYQTILKNSGFTIKSAKTAQNSPVLEYWTAP